MYQNQTHKILPYTESQIYINPIFIYLNAQILKIQ